MRRFTFLLLACTLFCAFSAKAQEAETAVTIYSKAEPGAVDPNLYRPVSGQQPGYEGAGVPGYAMVRQVRTMHIPSRESVIDFTDVAAYIDPTTVHFTSLTDPEGTKVAEQDYRFDLVSQQKLLEKYIDRKITVHRMTGSQESAVTGTLLSTQGGLVLKADDNTVQAINSYGDIQFPDLPGGLMTKPTLVWDVITGKPGDHKAEVSYETKGITWWADYNLTYREGKDADSGTVDFGSWVSILNQTGATFDKAKLKLVAGDVEHAQTPIAVRSMLKTMANAGAMDAAAPVPPSFAEKSFFEYHLYTLNRPVTLPDNATKQMELIPAAADVPVEKEYVFNATGPQYWGWGGLYLERGYGLDGEKRKPDVLLKFKNTKENGLGVPLPAGRMRVNQKDEDGSLEFIGESVIEHTPRNEEITIKLGQAFDVVGERKQVNFTLDSRNRTVTEEIEIRLRNQKKQPVKVKTLESLYRAADWEITETSGEYKKENAHQVTFVSAIEPEKEAVIRYTVRYKW